MIESLSGELLAKMPTSAVVECHGVGYHVHLNARSVEALPPVGKGVRLFIHYSVSVDVRSGQSDHRLYGFVTSQERELFRQLITVQGVSSTMGMSLMGGMGADELRSAILSGDLGRLKAVKGVGPKLAQRIVSDLGGRLGPNDAGALSSRGVAGNTPHAEALSALVSLGLDRSKAERALQGVLKEHDGADLPVEELIKLSLRKF
ncbi:MAG: Holliday junction branch migration protein RuvA [Flavobacteriales bacterium]|nr:Holliday junction branch migration protein RuvA [Flavobacteriales bacterium]